LYEFGAFRLDPTTRLLRLASGTAVPLPSRAFDALLYLVEHAGQLVPRATLTKAVWPTTVVEDNALNKVISALRDALGETEHTRDYIVTVPGRGYQFVAPVRRVATLGETQVASAQESEPTDVPIASSLNHAPAPVERRLAVAAAAVAVLLAVVLAATYLRAPPAPPQMRVEVTTPPTYAPASFALSPDGRQLVFIGETQNGFALWLRALDAETAKPLPGTADARHPFWSPDSRSIGFFTNDKLKRIDVDGSALQTLADVEAGLGGSWSSTGTIVFSSGVRTGLDRIPAIGGAPAPVTELDRERQTSHQFPNFLPNGRQFLFRVVGSGDAGGIFLASLDSPEMRRISAADSRAVYLSSGWLLYLREQVLIAQRFDLAREQLVDEPTVVATSVVTDSVVGTAAFSASASGLIAYRSASGSARRLVWLDRSGKDLGGFGETDPQLSNIAISPDGSRVAVERDVQGETGVWVLDGTRSTRVAAAPGFQRFPVWSPDGSRLAFEAGLPNGAVSLSEIRLAEHAEVRTLLTQPNVLIPVDWSPDGRFLLYFSPSPETGTDLWLLPLEPPGEPLEFSRTAAAEVWGEFSPDGCWVAYQSNVNGRHDVYVRPFPGPGAPFPVSTSGGVYPRWSADGKELYYIAPDGVLMAVPVSARDTEFTAGVPSALFQTRRVGGGASVVGRSQQYDVAADGRFLVNTEVGSAPPITLLINWQPPGG
jgi:DNA-binding winged helix-turn-helix (wHTH) protein/Tol biopolymer transport system component